MPKKPRKRTTPKKRDPSWQLRHALGQKVESNLKDLLKPILRAKPDGVVVAKIQVKDLTNDIFKVMPALAV